MGKAFESIKLHGEGKDAQPVADLDTIALDCRRPAICSAQTRAFIVATATGAPTVDSRASERSKADAHQPDAGQLAGRAPPRTTLKAVPAPVGVNVTVASSTNWPV